MRVIYDCPAQNNVKTTEFWNLGEEKKMFALTTSYICENSSVYHYLFNVVTHWSHTDK